MSEEWKPIPSAPGYSASSFGRIRRDAAIDRLGRRVPTSGCCLKPRLLNKRSGHWGVTLSCGGRILHRLVHRLVAEAFLGPSPEGAPMACHKDGDPTNNRAGNLYWGNGTTNAKDRTAHGRTLRGGDVGGAKLTADDVVAIRDAVARGEPQKAVGARYGVSQSNVAMIVTGRTWRHVA